MSSASAGSFTYTIFGEEDAKVNKHLTVGIGYPSHEPS